MLSQHTPEYLRYLYGPLGAYDSRVIGKITAEEYEPFGKEDAEKVIKFLKKHKILVV